MLPQKVSLSINLLQAGGFLVFRGGTLSRMLIDVENVKHAAENMFHVFWSRCALDKNGKCCNKQCWFCKTSVSIIHMCYLFCILLKKLGVTNNQNTVGSQDYKMATYMEQFLPPSAENCWLIPCVGKVAMPVHCFVPRVFRQESEGEHSSKHIFRTLQFLYSMFRKICLPHYQSAA